MFVDKTVNNMHASDIVLLLVLLNSWLKDTEDIDT